MGLEAMRQEDTLKDKSTKKRTCFLSCLSVWVGLLNKDSQR